MGWLCACGAVLLWFTLCWSLWCQDRIEGALGLLVCGSFGAVLWGPCPDTHAVHVVLVVAALIDLLGLAFFF